jgi:hypothetical protein
MGIQFSTEPVAKRAGPNATDTKIITEKAQIAVIVDLDKFRAEFGDECLLAMSDGTSLRVKSQGLNRSMVGKSAEAIQEAHYALLKGIRRVGKSAPTYALPNGTKWSGENWTEYQSLYAAQLIDMGTPADVARTISLQLQK